jgi:hypothetical protein
MSGTQVKAESCLDWRTPRPYMVPPFIGSFTAVQSDRPKDWCKWAEYPRRFAGRTLTGDIPTFGSGTPSLNSSQMCPVSKIGKGSAYEYITVQTAEGSLKLPREDQVLNYIPTCNTLDVVTHTEDTRLQAYPPRYYR